MEIIKEDESVSYETIMAKAAERWLFEKSDNRETNFEIILKMPNDEKCVARIEEFREKGSNANTNSGIAVSINKIFVNSQLPYKAKSYRDFWLVIERTNGFDIGIYNTGDKGYIKPERVSSIIKQMVRYVDAILQSKVVKDEAIKIVQKLKERKEAVKAEKSNEEKEKERIRKEQEEKEKEAEELTNQLMELGESID